MDANPFRRRADGGFAVRLRDEERELLRSSARELAETLAGEAAKDDPAVARLFPTAYPDDLMRNMEFDGVSATALLEERLEAIRLLERTAVQDRLTEEELETWMRIINDIRIVLGTRLNVTEETAAEDFESGDEPGQAFLLYAYLSALLESIVRAMGDPSPGTTVIEPGFPRDES